MLLMETGEVKESSLCSAVKSSHLEMVCRLNFLFYFHWSSFLYGCKSLQLSALLDIVCALFLCCKIHARRR